MQHEKTHQFLNFSKLKTSNFTPRFFLSNQPCLLGLHLHVVWKYFDRPAKLKTATSVATLRQFCTSKLAPEPAWTSRQTCFVCMPSLSPCSVYGWIRQCQFLTMFWRFSTLSSGFCKVTRFDNFGFVDPIRVFRLASSLEGRFVLFQLLPQV